MVDWKYTGDEGRGVLARESELGHLRTVTANGGMPGSIDDVKMICMNLSRTDRGYFPFGCYTLEITPKGFFGWRDFEQQEPRPATLCEIRFFIGQEHKGLTEAELGFVERAIEESEAIKYSKSMELAEGDRNGSP